MEGTGELARVPRGESAAGQHRAVIRPCPPLPKASQKRRVWRQERKPERIANVWEEAVPSVSDSQEEAKPPKRAGELQTVEGHGLRRQIRE